MKKEAGQIPLGRPPSMKGRAVSRFLFLNPPFICATYPPASGGQPSTAGIFGLAGSGTVPERHRCLPSWALTPRFHPCRRVRPGPGGSCGSFLLRPPCDCSHPGFPRRSALPCPDFPHRLPGLHMLFRPGTPARRIVLPHFFPNANVVKNVRLCHIFCPGRFDIHDLLVSC